jgi:hypothetical protein
MPNPIVLVLLQVHSLLRERVYRAAVILVHDDFISFLLFFQNKKDSLIEWKEAKKINRNEMCFLDHCWKYDYGSENPLHNEEMRLGLRLRKVGLPEGMIIIT